MNIENSSKQKTALMIVLALVIIIFIAAVSWYVGYKNGQDRSTETANTTSIISNQASNTLSNTVNETETETNSVASNQETLESIAFAAIEAATDGQWDNKLEVVELNASENAARGTWSAHDIWTWIAYKENDEQWRVLVSTDGFDCTELESIPAEHLDFFHDDIYTSSGSKYCYSH